MTTHYQAASLPQEPGHGNHPSKRRQSYTFSQFSTRVTDDTIRSMGISRFIRSCPSLRCSVLTDPLTPSQLMWFNYRYTQDALEHILTQAKKKLELISNVATYIGDVTALPPAILQDIQNRWGSSNFPLLTAQRVRLNTKKNRCVEVLRHWKSYLS